MAILRQFDGGAEAKGAGIVRIERQRPVERLPGFGRLAAQQMGLGGLGPVAGGLRITDRRGGGADRVRIVQRPLHRIERIEQDGLARRLTELDGGLFAGRHQHAALRVAELDQAAEHSQSSRIARLDCEGEFGASDGGGGRDGLEVQRFAAVAHPNFAVQHP